MCTVRSTSTIILNIKGTVSQFNLLPFLWDGKGRVFQGEERKTSGDKSTRKKMSPSLVT